MEVAWSPYVPDWQPLQATDPRRGLWTPDQVEIYDLYSRRNALRASPATFGKALTPRFRVYDYVKLISDLITALVEDRLRNPATGEPYDNLFLTMPPRHGKSFLLSQHVPAWYLSRNPNDRVILTSYEATFAASWGKKTRDILQEHGKREFGLELDPSSQAKDNWDLANPFTGGMNTAGMGGPITGKGGNLLIGDDWVKNAQEANSKTWRDGAWDWTVSTFLSRQEPEVIYADNGDILTKRRPKTVLLMTRWHEDDPPGRILQENPEDWYICELPALAREGQEDPLNRRPGEALCPDRFDEKELLKIQRRNAYWFEALYQGDPTPDEGGLFSKSSFLTYRLGGDSTDPNEAPGRPLHQTYVLTNREGQVRYIPVRDCRHFITADLAITLKLWGDYTVFSSWAYTPENDLLLLGRFRDRIEGPDHLQRLQDFHANLQARVGRVALVGIEDKTFGTTLISEANRHSKMSVRGLEADVDKFTRAIPASDLAKNGRLYFPANSPISEEFIKECVTFPNGAHDDQVDTLAYAAEVARKFFRKGREGRNPEGHRVNTASSLQDRLDAHVEGKIRDKKRKVRAGRFRL